MYSYDIFAASPCCLRRLKCKNCQQLAIDPGQNSPAFFSQFRLDDSAILSSCAALSVCLFVAVGVGQVLVNIIYLFHFEMNYSFTKKKLK